MMSSKGFTLIEALLTIVIISTASLAIFAPYIVSVRGIGSHLSPTGISSASALIQKEAEITSAYLASIPDSTWAVTMKGLAHGSPVIGSADIKLNGATYTFLRTYECVKKDFANDASCSSGFIRVTVNVTDAEAKTSLALPFIKTRSGI